MRGDVAWTHVETERHKTELAGELERFRSGIEAGDADRRMRLLQRAQMMAQRAQHRTGHVHAPELALVLQATVARPDFEHDVERLGGHFAVDALHSVDAEELPVAGQAACADAEHVTALGQMIHICDAAGEFGRMMIGQKVGTGRELDLARLHERLRDQQVGRGVGFPARGEVLADPRLAIAQAVGFAQHGEVPLLSGKQAALRRMRRHQKKSQLHTFSFLCIRPPEVRRSISIRRIPPAS
jgi:hypothetical protein